MGDPALVADEMLKKWSRNELSLTDTEAVGHFLIAFGFANALKENLALKLREGQNIPWSPLLRIISAQSRLDNQIGDALIVGAVELNESSSIARYPELVKLDIRFDKLANDFWKNQAAEIVKQKKKLQEQAQFLRNEGLTEQERSLLIEILALDAQDQEAKLRLQSLATQEAQNRIKRSGEMLDRDEILRAEAKKLSNDDKSLLKELATKIQKKSKKNSELKTDMALGMFLMGDTEGALTLIESAPKSESRDWLKLELLIESNHFVDALTWIDKLESEYSDKSETTPACVYARAKALWGLHQHKPAISLLESLVKSYPDYRSAHALLLEWKETGA